MRALLLVSCCLLLAAQEPLPWIGSGMRCDEAHPLLRGGLLYRLHLRAEGPVADLIPPLRLELRLIYGKQVLASASVNIDHPEQWRQGCALHLVPPARLPTAPLRLIALLDDDHDNNRARLEVTVDSVSSMRRQLGRLVDGPLRRADDPLPALWLEQAALLSTGSRRLPDCEALLERNARLAEPSAATAASRRQASHLDAFRARSDGSLQPYRLHRPPGDEGEPALLVWAVRHAKPLDKAHWPALDTTQLSDALAAGFTVLAVYPAGQRPWEDLGPRRIAQALAAVGRRHPHLAEARQWLASQGAPSDALLAARPWQDVLVTDTIDGPAAWRRLRRQGREADWQAPEARDYAAGPFTVVIGSGEHLAAQEQARSNALRFMRAWTAHSQGDADWVWDHEAAGLLEADRHLVCFGNPRSNAVVADLFGQGELPLDWDPRSLHDSADTGSWLRDQSTAVLVLPHPRQAGRLVYICDGVDIGPLLGDGLPLAGLPPVTVIDADGRHLLPRQ